MKKVSCKDISYNHFKNMKSTVKVRTVTFTHVDEDKYEVKTPLLFSLN